METSKTEITRSKTVFLRHSLKAPPNFYLFNNLRPTECLLVPSNIRQSLIKWNCKPRNLSLSFLLAISTLYLLAINAHTEIMLQIKKGNKRAAVITQEEQYASNKYCWISKTTELSIPPTDNSRKSSAPWTVLQLICTGRDRKISGNTALQFYSQSPGHSFHFFMGHRKRSQQISNLLHSIALQAIYCTLYLQAAPRMEEIMRNA